METGRVMSPQYGAVVSGATYTGTAEVNGRGGVRTHAEHVGGGVRKQSTDYERFECYKKRKSIGAL